jgi:hypothetical protein
MENYNAILGLVALPVVPDVSVRFHDPVSRHLFACHDADDEEAWSVAG